MNKIKKNMNHYRQEGGKICNFVDWITSKDPYSFCDNHLDFQHTAIHRTSLSLKSTGYDREVYQRIYLNLESTINRFLEVNPGVRLIIHFIIGTTFQPSPCSNGESVFNKDMFSFI
jgi:hypothetical protein